MSLKADNYQDIRDAVRALCATFPDEYFRRVDMAREYPAEFVDALTQAGWVAALVPHEHGDSGLGLAEASVIMEEINRSGGVAVATQHSDLMILLARTTPLAKPIGQNQGVQFPIAEAHIVCRGPIDSAPVLS